MKILWLCNIPLPQISENLKSPVVNAGGWLTGMSNALCQMDDIELHILFPHGDNVSGEIGKISYQGFNNTEQFKDILTRENPALVHVFGTEYKHTLDMVNACEELNLQDKLVVNIQGLLHIIAQHYDSGIPFDVRKGGFFKNLISGNGIEVYINDFKKRGEFELETLRKVKHIIGRTDWDRACVTQINPDVNYYFCNETLRDSFYNNAWDIDKCEKYSIFLSQASYPVKGLHFMLEALPQILSQYPTTKVYIAGESPFVQPGMLFEDEYSKYLNSLIEEHNLGDKIVFVGSLGEEQMCNRFLKSHVFVSCSTIENESNSVSEAKILGVPVVASFVGGVTNRISHKEDGFLYQHNASYMLAYYVSEIFRNDELALKFSQNASNKAKKIHNRSENLERLISIYKKISKY